MSVQVQINDHFANADDAARVEAAIAAFQDKTGMSDAEVIAAHKDCDSDRFDEIDSLVYRTATEGWAGNHEIGEIVLSVA